MYLGLRLQLYVRSFSVSRAAEVEYNEELSFNQLVQVFQWLIKSTACASLSVPS
jgi:hypothetical protein